MSSCLCRRVVLPSLLCANRPGCPAERESCCFLTEFLSLSPDHHAPAHSDKRRLCSSNTWRLQFKEMNWDYSSEKRKKKEVHPVRLKSKLTDMRARKGRHFTSLHNSCCSHPRRWCWEGGRWPHRPSLSTATRCLTLKSCNKAAASGGTADSVCPNRNVISPEGIAVQPPGPTAAERAGGRDGQMCSDRSGLLPPPTRLSASIVSGCQGAEWCLLSWAQVRPDSVCVYVCLWHAMFWHV